MIGVRIPAPLGFQVEGETKVGRVRLEINWDRLSPVTKWLLWASDPRGWWWL